MSNEAALIQGELEGRKKKAERKRELAQLLFFVILNVSISFIVVGIISYIISITNPDSPILIALGLLGLGSILGAIALQQRTRLSSIDKEIQGIYREIEQVHNLELQKENDNYLLRLWYKNLRVLNKAHWETSEKLKRRGLWGGGFVILLTAIVGSEVFINLTTNPNFLVQLTAGIFSIMAVSLSAVLNYLHYPERAERHRRMGIEFGRLKRRVHAVLIVPEEKAKENKDFLKKVRDKWYEIAQDEPSVPQELYKRVRTDIMKPPSIPKKQE